MTPPTDTPLRERSVVIQCAGLRQAALRKHLEESFFGAKINIEHVREMSIGPEAMNLLKINLDLDAKARLKRAAATVAASATVFLSCTWVLQEAETFRQAVQAVRASLYFHKLSVLLLTCGLRS